MLSITSLRAAVALAASKSDAPFLSDVQRGPVWVSSIGLKAQNVLDIIPNLYKPAYKWIKERK